MKNNIKNDKFQTILSLQNPLIKKIKNLSKKNNEKSEQQFMSEGNFFLKEAINSNWNISYIIYNIEKKDRFLNEDFYRYLIKNKTNVIFVNAKILKHLSQKDNPQDFLFTAIKKKFLAPKILSGNHFSLALENIRDPGNLGNIFRTMNAFGITYCFLIGDCVNPYSLEVNRASMGALFNLKFVRFSQDKFLNWINKNDINLYGTSLETKESHLNFDWKFPLTIAMGNEQKGLSKTLKANCKNLIKIITKERMKSLNVSVATALMINEVNRKNPI